MSLKFKPKTTVVVQLCRNGQVVADVPCSCPDDVELAKSILLRYLATVEDPELYTLQQIALSQVQRSIL